MNFVYFIVCTSLPLISHFYNTHYKLVMCTLNKILCIYMSLCFTHHVLPHLHLQVQHWHPSSLTVINTWFVRFTHLNVMVKNMQLFLQCWRREDVEFGYILWKKKNVRCLMNQILYRIHCTFGRSHSRSESRFWNNGNTHISCNTVNTVIIASLEFFNSCPTVSLPKLLLISE